MLFRDCNGIRCVGRRFGGRVVGTQLIDQRDNLVQFGAERRDRISRFEASRDELYPIVARHRLPMIHLVVYTAYGQKLRF